jgi:NAD dependent epimerase/dehydratase family enzyme
MSWVHHEDFVRALRWLIDHDELAGVVNVASPEPLPQVEFMRALRRAARMPFGLSGTSWMMEIAAFVHGTESELILKSRRVIPARLVENGFRFVFPSWPDAAADLVKRPQVAASFVW